MKRERHVRISRMSTILLNVRFIKKKTRIATRLIQLKMVKIETSGYGMSANNIRARFVKTNMSC